MRYPFLLLLVVISLFLGCSNSLFAQSELEQILTSSKRFDEIVKDGEAYFRQKHPGVPFVELTRGKNRDGQFVKFMRWRSYWENSLNADGTLGDPTAYFKAQQGQPKSSSSPYANVTWNNLSYNNYITSQIGMGRTTSMAFHPTNPNIWYVGAAIGGIWRTTNGGQSYVPLGDNLPFLAVSSIVVNRNNPNIIYIAVSDHVWYGPPSIGVYKSTNGGATWSPTSLGFNFTQDIRIYRLEADPRNPNVIFAATANGIYRTTNGFASVAKVSNLSAFDVRVHPTNSAIVYAGGRNGEFYRSTNGGASFAGIRDFGNGEVFLAVTPRNPAKVYARIGSTMHKSFNNGGSFTATSTFNDQNSNDVFIFAPTNDNIILAGNFEIHRSNNGGASWTTVTNWLGQGGKPLVHVDQRNIFVNPLQSDFIYFCNDGGIYRYRISSNSFDNLCDGLQITQFYDIAVSQTNANIIGGGSQDNGNVYRESNGVWNDYAPTGDGMNQEIDPTNSAYRYWAYQLGGMYRWVNGNNTPIAPPGQDGQGAWETPYKLDPNNPAILIAGYDRVYRSTNRGSSWTAISGVLNGGADMEELAIAPSNSNRIYTSSGNRLFVKNTTNNGWVTRTLPGPRISDLEVSPTNANLIYVTVSGYINGSKVFRSTNAGASWQNISGSLPNVSTDAIETYRNEPNALFVGTDAGVYYRDDNLSDWVEYGQIPHTRVDDIEIQYSSRRIRIGTHGRGVLEAPINILCPDSDNDGVCNADDRCPNFNDSLIGAACNDGNGATYNDRYTTNCRCEGTAYSLRLNVNKSEVCAGETAQLQATTSGLPNAAYRWQWSANGTTWNESSTDPNAPTWNLNVGNLSSQPRWWRVIVTSNGFTTTSHPVKTTVIQAPNINVANVTSCVGGSATLTATGYNPNGGCFDLSDFIGGVDGRGSLRRNGGGVSYSAIRYAGGDFGTNYWDMTVNNAALQHYVDYDINIPIQDFRGFKTISIGMSYGGNPRFELFLFDHQQGYSNLGFGPGTGATFNLPTDAARKDAVRQLKIRFHTRDLGGNGVSRRCHISNIRLCGSDFRWSNGATTTSITVSPNTTTNYTATASYGNCSRSNTGTVSIQGNPNVSLYHSLNNGGWIAGNNVRACAGDRVLLDMGGAFAGWSVTFTRPDGAVFPGGTGGVSNDQLRINGIGDGSVNEGQWRVNYTNPSGCSGSGVFNVSVTSSPTAVRLNVDESELCSGDGTTLRATVTGGSNLSYVWQWSANGTSWNESGTDPNAPVWNLNAGNLANGNRWWRVRVTGCGGTITSHPVKTTVIQAPNINVANVTSCVGGQATLTATGYNPNGGCFDLTDFIGNVDARGGLTRSGGGVSFSPIRYAGGDFGTNYWDMRVSNAAANHYIDYNFSIPAQNFSSFKTINIGFSYGGNPSFRLYIRDEQQGYTNLGTGSGAGGTFNLPSDPARKDAVHLVKVRFRTSDLGGNGVSRRCHISRIRLCGSDFRWSNGATTTSITVSPNTTTNYTATAKYGDCSRSNTGTVSIQSGPNLGLVHAVNNSGWIFSPNVDACTGDNVLLDMNGAFGGWTMTFTRPDGRVFPGGTGGVSNDQLRINNIQNYSVNEGPWMVNYTNPSGCSGSGVFNVNVTGGGTVCNDGNAATIADRYQANCTCVGIPASGDLDGDGMSNQDEANACNRDPYEPADLNFDFNRSTEGFARNQIVAYSTGSPTYWLLRADYTNDPFIYKGGFSFAGNEVPYIKIRVRSQRAGAMQLFWGRAGAGGFSASRVATVNYPTANQWQEITFNVGNHPQWQGQTITALRLDFPQAVGGQIHYWLDYLRGPLGANASATTNLALGGAATQSSLAHGGVAQRAINGNTSGQWNTGSVTHTVYENRPWWQVELPNSKRINEIRVFNRTDCCSNRLANFRVSIEDGQGNTVFSEIFANPPNPRLDIPVGGVNGKTVKVQLLQSGYLTLAEVEVYGCDGGGIAPLTTTEDTDLTGVTYELEAADNAQNTTSHPDDLQAFPNPFRNELNSQFIPSDTERMIYLIDVNGRVVQQQVVYPGQERATFDFGVANLKPGVYLVRLLSEDQQMTRKVMKLR